MMRLLQETEEHAPENMPTVIIAENVKGLKPYLKVLEIEYRKRGYKAHYQLFNSKYWNVAQSRERYAVVGTREKENLSYSFPVEQHEFIPKLSGFLDGNVDEKYYIEDSKAKTILKQALERLADLGKCHATLTPDREKKRQRGPRAKPDEEPMFTLTAQDIHGVIVSDDSGGNLQNREYEFDEEMTNSIFTDKDNCAYCCQASYQKGLAPSKLGKGSAHISLKG